MTSETSSSKPDSRENELRALQLQAQIDAAATAAQGRAALVTPQVGSVLDDKGALTGNIPHMGKTDDTTPLIQGAGVPPGAVVTIYDNGVEIARIRATSDGKWRYAAGMATPLAAGKHAITVIYEFEGQTSARSDEHIFFIDNEPPPKPVIIEVLDDVGAVTGRVPKNGTTDDTRPELKGSAEAGCIVKVYDGTRLLGSTQVDDLGYWSFTPATDLAKGKHNLLIEALDEVGNSSGKVGPWPLTISTSTPTVSISHAMDDVGSITGKLSSGGITDDATPTLYGQAAAGGLVKIYDGAVLKGSVTADSSGNWSFTLPSLSDGLHTLSATVTTAVSGESAKTGAFGLTIDTVAPVVTLTVNTVAGNNVVNKAEAATSQTISGKASGEFKSGDLVKFILNGVLYSAAVGASGNWSVSVAGSELAKGRAINATLTTTDEAGNSATATASRTYTVDTVAPVANLIIDNIAGDNIVNAAEAGTLQTLSGTASGEFRAGDTIKVLIGQVNAYTTTVNAAGKWSVSVPGSILAANRSVLVNLDASDAAGNKTTVAVTRDYTVDTVAPVAGLTIDTVAGDDVVNAAEAATSQTISGKATGEFKSGDLVKFTLNGQAYSAAVDASGNWSVSVAGSDLAKGTAISATLTASDAAGNTSTAITSRTYTVDTSAPNSGSTQLSISVIAGDDVLNAAEAATSQTINGKATGEFKAGDLVKFTLNGKAYSAAVNAWGNWSVSVAGSDLAKGTAINATLSAHDAAGNIGEIVATRPYSVSTSGPTASLTVNAVAGDNIVNAAEAAASQTISGKASGEFRSGDLVKFTLNGKAYSAAVNASGDWSVSVAGSDLAKGTAINATLTASDAAGNTGTATASRAYTVDTSAPNSSSTQLSINVIAGDDVLNAAESAVSQTISGKATGEFKAGDLVKFTLNGRAYSAAVDASGNWSVSVAGSDLAKGSAINATLTAHDAAGNVGDIVAARSYSVSTTGPTASLSINTVAGDNIVNAAEAAASQTISGKASGEFKSGDLVKFSVNGKAYSAAVNASGDWSVSVAGSDLAKGTAINATLTASDAAGNTGTATASRAYTVDTVSPVATLTVNAVAGDNIVNAAEAATSQTISGKASGEFRSGDLVKFTLNGKAYSAAVDASGNWSVSVAGSDLAKGTAINATLTASDAAGNTADATTTRAYTVQVLPTAKAAIASMDKDSGISATDWLTNNGDAGRLISGTISGTLAAGEKVQVSTNGGATWTDAFVSGSKWGAMDLNVHKGNWTINTRVVGSGGVVGSGVDSRAVTLDTVAPSAPKAVALSGSKLSVTLGSGMKAGEMLDVVQGDLHFQYVLKAADITAGTATFALPSGTTESNINVASVDQAGNRSAYTSLPGVILIDFEVPRVELDRGQSLDLGAITVTNIDGVIKPEVEQYNPVNGIGTTYTNYQGKNATSMLGVMEGSLNLDLKGGRASSITVDIGDVQTIFYEQEIRFYDGNKLVHTADLYRYHQLKANSGRSYVKDVTFDMPAGVTFTRFEFDAGTDWIVMDNLRLKMTTLAPPSLNVVAGSSAYYGDASDNTFTVKDVSVLSSASIAVHGNSGIDTLKLTGAGQTLDVSTLTAAGKLSGVEVLDITGTGNNTLKLSLGDVLELGGKDLFRTNGDVQMQVKGNAGDVVKLDDILLNGIDPGNWASAGTVNISGVTYVSYQYSTMDAELLVQQGVTVNLV